MKNKYKAKNLPTMKGRTIEENNEKGNKKSEKRKERRKIEKTNKTC